MTRACASVVEARGSFSHGPRRCRRRHHRGQMIARHRACSVNLKTAEALGLTVWVPSLGW
jgi:hypothetical protein